MPITAVTAQRHAVNLYFLGLGFIMAGACLMDYFDSVAPFAACASTSVLLSVPLLQQLKLRYLARRADQHGS